MAKRRTSSQRRKSAEATKAFRNIAMVGAVLGVIGFFYFRTVLNHKTLDDVTLCPANPTSVTVLLIDVTDPMNLPQRQDFMNQLDKLSSSIPRYGQLVVTKIDPVSNRLLIPIITRCNPGSAKDETEVSGNPQLVEKLHREKYEAPLKSAFERVLGASEAKRSPILESIQSVALTELQRPAVARIPKRLIVASDLLQNTDTISFYRGLPDPGEFTSSQEFSRVRTDLRGVDVELWMLQRGDSKHTQPRALPDLWNQIITKQGGNLIRVYNVSG